MTQTFFHVGFPKAASSTLQKSLFSRHSGILNLGVYPKNNVGYNQDLGGDSDKGSEILFLENQYLRKFLAGLANKDELSFCYEEYRNLFNKISRYYDGRSAVFSNEAMTGLIFSYPDIKIKAERLKEVMGSIKILIVVREQISILRAQYRDQPFDPRCPRLRRPVNFEEWIDLDVSKNFFSYCQSLNYNLIVSIYEELFGSENIAVVPVELLSEDVSEFSNLVSNFIDVDEKETEGLLWDRQENTGVSTTYNNLRRLKARLPLCLKSEKIQSNFLTKKILDRVKRFSKEEVPIKEETLNWLGEYFKEGNRKLSQDYDLRLGELGYFT